jgi:hypothetical protein
VASSRRQKPKSKKKRSSKPNYKLRARNIVIRQIAEMDGISFREASRKTKRAIVEYVYERAYSRVARRFLQVAPGQWLEIEKGKPARAVNTFGDVRDVKYIERVRRMESYWRTITIYRETFGVSIKTARKIYRDRGRQFVMEELGTFVSYRMAPSKEQEEDEDDE